MQSFELSSCRCTDYQFFFFIVVTKTLGRVSINFQVHHCSLPWTYCVLSVISFEFQGQTFCIIIIIIIIIFEKPFGIAQFVLMDTLLLQAISAGVECLVIFVVCSPCPAVHFESLLKETFCFQDVYRLTRWCLFHFKKIAQITLILGLHGRFSGFLCQHKKLL